MTVTPHLHLTHCSPIPDQPHRNPRAIDETPEIDARCCRLRKRQRTLKSIVWVAITRERRREGFDECLGSKNDYRPLIAAFRPGIHFERDPLYAPGRHPGRWKFPWSTSFPTLALNVDVEAYSGNAPWSLACVWLLVSGAGRQMETSRDEDVKDGSS